MELKRYKLGEILELQRGYDLPSSQQKAGNVLVAGSNGIIGYHNEIRGNHPCITVGRSGSVGKVHYYDTDAASVEPISAPISILSTHAICKA